MIISGHFDKIFSEDCFFSGPKINNGTLIICVRNIGVISGHPLFPASWQTAIRYFAAGHFIFDGVEASIREISEYEVSRHVNKFKPKRTIQDGPFIVTAGKKESFRFMGVLDSPPAWTDWTVIADSFSLEIPESESLGTSI